MKKEVYFVLFCTVYQFFWHKPIWTVIIPLKTGGTRTVSAVLKTVELIKKSRFKIE